MVSFLPFKPAPRAKPNSSTCILLLLCSSLVLFHTIPRFFHASMHNYLPSSWNKYIRLSPYAKLNEHTTDHAMYQLLMRNSCIPLPQLLHRNPTRHSSWRVLASEILKCTCIHMQGSLKLNTVLNMDSKRGQILVSAE